MRFPKETRATIYEAQGEPVTIKWPTGEPIVGRTYYLQSAEQLEADRERRAESPDTHAEVMAGMAKRAGLQPAPSKRKRRYVRPRADESRIYVIAAEQNLDHSWQAKVALYEDPDPIRHLQIKARVPAGADPIDGFQVATETEQEQLPELSTHDRRREEEDALKLEHKASIDRGARIKAEQHLANLRRRGKPSPQAEAAADRARKREAEAVGSAA